MKTILFPTDFSKNADNALRYAVDLCEVMQAKLLLFNSCNVPDFASMVPVEEETEKVIYNTANDHLKEYLRSSFLRGKKIDVQTKVVFGQAVDNILEEARQNNVELIVMGTKGGSVLEQMLIGSVTAAVMENANCPVLAIPSGCRFTGFRRMAFATDYHDTDIETIIYLTKFAAVFNSEISIVHISDALTTDDYERDLFRLFKEKVMKEVAFPAKSFILITGMDIEKTLSDFTDEYKIDLIALSTRKRNFVARLFDRSLTKKFVFNTHVPLMSLHFE